jgi:hypothetical protein
MDTASPEDLPPSPALATLQLESLQRKGKRQNNPDRIWPTVQKKMKKLLADLDVALLSIVMMALHKGQVV